MPDLISIGLGGGSIIRENNNQVSVGPDSVGYKLDKEALIFGGKTLTTSDITVASGDANFGDKSKVEHIRNDLITKSQNKIKNMIEAHIRDGVAVTKFLYWIKNSNIKKLDEIKVEKKLESFRQKSKNYLFPSFNTIAGSGPNGAIIHYRSNIKSNRKLNKDHLLLVD